VAHYAYLNESNVVVAVIVGKNETELINGLDTETYYSQGTPYTVKRTSYNGNIRKQFAGKGYTYDPLADVFVAPQPYPSWSLDENFDWQPPVNRPDEDLDKWSWDENSLSWLEVNE
jgi:hypothetical protein